MDRPDCDATLLALTDDALGPEASSAVEQVAERLGEGPRLLRTVARSADALEALVGHAAATARKGRQELEDVPREEDLTSTKQASRSRGDGHEHSQR